MEMTIHERLMDFNGIIDSFKEAVSLKRPKRIIILGISILTILSIIITVSISSCLSNVVNKTAKKPIFLPAPGDISKKKGTVIKIKINGERIILYEESHALLIGISEYKHWNDLPCVPSELSLLKSALERKGFIVEMHGNLTSATLKEKIEKFISKNGIGKKNKNNRLLIFFSGHGCTRNNGKKGYIVPADAPCPEDHEIEFVYNAIDMDQIQTWARKIESKHALFVFDCCFSGTVLQTKGSPLPAYVTYLTGKPVRQFITAGDEKERVPGKSIFLQCFIKGIEGDADNSKAKDCFITGTELGIYLQKEVSTYYKAGHTPQFGKLRDPEFDRGDFIFINCTPPPPPDTCSIVIGSSPAKADIEIDGIFKGLTPQTIQFDKGKKYNLKIKKKGFKPYTGTIDCIRKDVNAMLEPIDKCFESLGCEVDESIGNILKIRGSFAYSRDRKYWICFMDDRHIWPKIEISNPELKGTAAVPKTGFYGGKLVIIRVQNETHEQFRKSSSPYPLIRPGGLSVLLETKINIK